MLSYTVAQQDAICKARSMEAAHYKGIRHEKSAPQTAFYEVSYYRLNLDLDPSIRYISGSVSTYFTPNTPLSSIVFDLTNQLTVDSVRYHGNSISFSQVGSLVVEATFSTPLPANILDSITIFYQGTPPGPANNLPFAQSSINGDPILWTLSEPYGAKDWWPCKNSLNDKADSVELLINTTLGNRVASNGLLLSIDTLGSKVQYHWKTNYPTVPYLVSIAIANYDFYEEYLHVGSDSVLMQHFLYQHQALANSSNETEEFMIFFTNLFGEYPFIKEKYGHASFTFGGGMEHQTMSSMGSYGGELKAHELAHQWFGNKITCASWKDLWLNEGFATYLTLLTYEYGVVHSPGFYANYLGGMEQGALLHPHGSVYRLDTTVVFTLFNQQVYEKGGFVLHMLRWKIGDQAFFQAVSNYINDPALSYGFANTKELKAHFEATSGINLDDFFADWVYGKGFPSYTTHWSQNGNWLDLDVYQAQSDTSVDFFNLPIAYHLYSNTGWDSTVVVDPDSSGQRFSFNIPHTITVVVFDEENKVLNGSSLVTNITENILKQTKVSLYPNPSSNEVFIQSDFPAAFFKRIRILDLQGKEVMRHPFSNSLSLAHLPSGVYVLQLDSEKGSIHKKLIKTDN
jgi:aminopeptidase N